jgi:hypothetical protein
VSSWRRPTLLLVVAALLLSGCAPGAGAARHEAEARSTPSTSTSMASPEEDTAQPVRPPGGSAPSPDEPEPRTDPEEPAAGEIGRSGPPAAVDEPAAAAPPPDEPSSTATTPPPATTPPTTSAVTDPAGDTSPPALGRAPTFADLVAGEVHSTAAEVVVTFEFAAPPQDERDTTLNVASFHDLTGDGQVDLEVWANHSEDGWYPSWRDNREGRAAFGPDSGVVARADGARLTLTVPAARFGGTTRWRWALGLEWGRYEWLGTAAAAHDAAPDTGLVEHPG